MTNVTLSLISAGEFFELLRPAAYVVSALLSVGVLASARRRGVRLYLGLPLSLGTFLLPFVVLPLYLIVLIFRNLGQRSQSTNELRPVAESGAPRIEYRFLLPAVYGIVLLAVTAVYLYRDYNSIDAHLARATQAKLRSQPAQTIREYRAALTLEDDPHTHKLLGVELAETGQWTKALNEFRLAEQGGEADESLSFRIATVLSEQGDHDQSAIEYQKFLNSHACRQELPDYRCESARKVLEQKGR